MATLLPETANRSATATAQPAKRQPLRPGSDETTVRLQQGVNPAPQRRSLFLWGLAWTVSLYASAVCCIPGILSAENYDLAVAGVVISYLALVIESLRSPTLGYLWGLNWVEDVADYIERLKSYRPKLTFHGECYHYETRTRDVPETYTEYEYRVDPVSHQPAWFTVTKTRMKQETYEAKVVSHREQAEFKYEQCRDVSAPLTDEIYKYQATRVDLQLRWEPDDLKTAERYQAERAAFVKRNKHRDTHFSFAERQQLKDFRARMLAIVDLEQKSPWMHWGWYAAASFATLSWPYRYWLERETVQGSYTLLKRIRG